MDKAAVPRVVDAYAWRVLVVLTIIYAFHNMDRAILAILIPPIKAEFALTDGQLGVLTGLAFGALYAAAGLALGPIIDRANRRNLLAALLFVWSACTALCGLARDFWSLLAARAAVGVSEAGGSPTSMSIIGDLFPPERRATALGAFWMSTAVGAALAFAVGGFVAQHYGWRTAFFIAGTPGVLMVLVLLLLVREPVRGATEAVAAQQGDAPPLLQAWAVVLRNRRFLYALLGTTSISIAGSGVLVWVPALLVRTHDFGLFQAGLVAAVTALVIGSTATYVGGRAADALERTDRGRGAWVPAASGFLSCGAGVVLVLAHSPLAAVLGVVLWEVTFRLYFGPGNNMIVSSVEPRLRGVAASLSQAGTNLFGWGLGPTMVGVVSDRVGGENSLRWGLASVMMFSLVAGVFFMMASRAAPRPTATAPVLARGSLAGGTNEPI